MPSPKSSNNAATLAPERASRVRQRQRLIDACISALHLYGPSRTTVEKVVAIADMSPGIVRFYFDSKDAMLVASLAYLASEFEERVLKPVFLLRETPVRALERIVELYLDPDIASPRKVSVWYSFWGEASSRQEYLEICGKKDDDFASLVRELVQRVIVEGGESHLDADAVALGLIGVLEVLWQGIAFTDEAQIDRSAARRRSLAYLRSVFPRQFGAGAVQPAVPGVQVPAWAYSDGALLSLERERLFRPSWQMVGHESDIPRVGDYLAVDLAGERALVVRDKDGIRAFRNSCRKRPHAIVTSPRGRLSEIQCGIHGLTYDLEGRLISGRTAGNLTPLEMALPGRFIMVQTPVSSSGPASMQTPGSGPAASPVGDWLMLPDLRPAGAEELDVAADWKLVVEQWLDALPRPKGVRREILAPNQLLEIGPAGVLVLQIIPLSPGSCRIRRLDYAVAGKRSRTAAQPAQRPLAWLQQDVEVAESTQTGLATGANEADEAGPVPPPLAEFRRTVAALVARVEQARRRG